MAEYRLSRAAERDLEGIFAYTADHWGLAQALRYTDELQAACAALAADPARGRDCSHIRAAYRCYAVERHVIFFNQCPRNTGLRFSLNARTPSRRSSVSTSWL